MHGRPYSALLSASSRSDDDESANGWPTDDEAVFHHNARLHAGNDDSETAHVAREFAQPQWTDRQPEAPPQRTRRLLQHREIHVEDPSPRETLRSTGSQTCRPLTASSVDPSSFARLVRPQLTPLLLRCGPLHKATEETFIPSPWRHSPVVAVETLIEEDRHFATPFWSPSLRAECSTVELTMAYPCHRALVHPIVSRQAHRVRVIVLPPSSHIEVRTNECGSLLSRAHFLLPPLGPFRGRRLRPVWETVIPLREEGHHRAVPASIPGPPPLPVLRLAARSIKAPVLDAKALYRNVPVLEVERVRSAVAHSIVLSTVEKEDPQLVRRVRIEQPLHKKYTLIRRPPMVEESKSSDSGSEARTSALFPPVDRRPVPIRLPPPPPLPPISTPPNKIPWKDSLDMIPDVSTSGRVRLPPQQAVAPHRRSPLMATSPTTSVTRTSNKTSSVNGASRTPSRVSVGEGAETRDWPQRETGAARQSKQYDKWWKNATPENSSSHVEHVQSGGKKGPKATTPRPGARTPTQTPRTPVDDHRRANVVKKTSKNKNGKGNNDKYGPPGCQQIEDLGNIKLVSNAMKAGNSRDARTPKEGNVFTRMIKTAVTPVRNSGNQKDKHKKKHRV